MYKYIKKLMVNFNFFLKNANSFILPKGRKPLRHNGSSLKFWYDYLQENLFIFLRKEIQCLCTHSMYSFHNSSCFASVDKEKTLL